MDDMLRRIEFLGHHISKNEILSQQDDQEESDLGDSGNC